MKTYTIERNFSDSKTHKRLSLGRLTSQYSYKMPAYFLVVVRKKTTNDTLLHTFRKSTFKSLSTYRRLKQKCLFFII